MKRQSETRRRGVVLLLILGLMAMFAISVLSYMVVTSNMAETAQNAQKLDAVVVPPAQNDIDVALRNLIAGSGNESNPIAPFSILENMYGDWRVYDFDAVNNAYINTSTTFDARIAIFPNLGYAVLTPVTDFRGNKLFESGFSDYDVRLILSSYFEESGNVMTLLGLVDDPLDSNPLEDNVEQSWSVNAENTSTFVLDKVITDPSSTYYQGGSYWLKHYFDSLTENSANTDLYDDFNYWHFKIELSDDLKKFASDVDLINGFNRKAPVVTVRLNRPAYSGTGAGGFMAGALHDATLTPPMTPIVPGVKNLLLGMCPSYVFWMNPSAPDMWPFYLTNNSRLDFRAYWAHLADVNYDCRELNGQWNGSAFQGDPVVNGYSDPIRMSSPYTAPDSKSPFLAHFSIDEDGAYDPTIPYEVTPSFHRTGAFRRLVPRFGHYRGAFGSLGIPADAHNAYLTALVRKLTPRPLPLDHWNFTGSNPDVDHFYANPGTSGIGLSVESLAGALGNSLQWDVDNDNDGVREGIWLPSGLPIRYDKNGTPYATMFSYTVVDLDGRVNVNTAGNWDQIPYNNLGTIKQPYNYVDELVDVLNGVSSSVAVNTPYYYSDDLSVEVGGFNWNNDHGVATIVATRGEGRGASSVLIYEALAAAYKTFNDDYVQAIATNLLWRRNLEQYNIGNGAVNTAGLVWNTNGLELDGMKAPQPGVLYPGDSYYASSIGNANVESEWYEAHRFMDPFVVGIWDSTSTIGASKVVFPWRGKTTIDMSTSVSAIPAFDWADTAFRSYDPLGAQIYTYAPRYSSNPYLARQNMLSWQDMPYSVAMLERLLRPADGDVATLPSQLVDDLLVNSDLYVGLLDRGALNNPDTTPADAVSLAVRDRARVRTSFTTVSNDVPAPALVFPENYEEERTEKRYGSYGFVSLIRRNVESELRRVLEVKGLCLKEKDDKQEFNLYIDKVDENPAVAGNRAVFYKKVDEITSYLASMLPREILVGEKIDLNALSQKNYWLDVDYDVNGGYKTADENLHNTGLIKRMEYARGLYLVVMTLLYEDMNARRLYDPNGTLDEVDKKDDDGNIVCDVNGNGIKIPNPDKLSDYIEGSFDLLSFDNENEKNLLARELMATRIAQWCVNVVDFSDPDATMTPFFFDPTPFDGWWVDWEKSVYNPADGSTTKTSWLASEPAKYNWQHEGWNVDDDPETPFLFPSSAGVPTEQMNAFFHDAFERSRSYTKVTAADHSVYHDPNDGGTDYYHSYELIARWMSKKIEKLEDQTTDLGFRVVWGMERPDLVLTETLNFHDLGIADTEIAYDASGRDSRSIDVGGDDTFDQVRRPTGSSYLEFYCTANPSVPQSNELYDYDETANGGAGAWKLRLSKLTPTFTDLSDNGTTRGLEFPVWRVAISDSTDPRGLNRIEDKSGSDVTETRKSANAVYHKSRNSILEWLLPHQVKDQHGNAKYFNDTSFFSMQPRQFRNYPMPTDSTLIANIAHLDPDRGTEHGNVNEEAKDPDHDFYLAHWKNYNLPASNLLGPAIAKTYDDWRFREVELDRILWFSHPTGDDGVGKLGAAGKFPDALRTFGNKSDEIVYLKPNQYLVVGPEKKRSIGSAAFVSTNSDETQRQFGQAPDEVKFPWAYIDLEKLSLPKLVQIEDDQKYAYMEAVANIGGRGFNISEPLWTSASEDPYYADQGDKIENSGVRNVPFEIPDGWGGDHKNDPMNTTSEKAAAQFYDDSVVNYPIVKDEIFGLGTIPAYKSAFVQRVADPNRPYHPVMNPYITVDWNMMDLTIFTGEADEETKIDCIKEVNKRPFSISGVYPFGDNNNKIKLARNLSVGLSDADKSLQLDKVFSSHQWGSQQQKRFAPSLSDSSRPNPWARAIEFEKNDECGLLNPTPQGYVSGTDRNSPAFLYTPKHSLGFYNDHGEWGRWGMDTVSGSRKFVKEGEDTTSMTDLGPFQYRNLNATYQNSIGVDALYRGSPRKPFEHLVWNDAPFSNPYELMLVPASSPGRFGLEFVRDHHGSDFNLESLYAVDTDKNGALGSFGFFGFSKWYTDDVVVIDKTIQNPSQKTIQYNTDQEAKKQIGRAGFVGPYLNFFQSSKIAGHTLNLNRLLEFVHVPTAYLGAKKLAGTDMNGNLIVDQYGNVELRSTHREPGKVNINTLSKPVWHALVNTTDRPLGKEPLPGTPWEEFQNSRNSNAYFQPAHVAPLWCQMDQSADPIGSYLTLLAQHRYNNRDKDSVKEEPIFDNVRQRYSQDDDGNTWYTYTIEVDDPNGARVDVGETTDRNWLDLNLRTNRNPDGPVLSYEEIKTPRRGNLFDATAEMQRLSGLTTTRSNVFAAWVTVGYFEVERCNPGVNMPNVDPDGNTITLADLVNPDYKWYYYYQAIYPDGYTYGKELGSDYGETQRHRGFSIIDRSIPVDFRRGSSVNYEKTILTKHVIE